MKWLLAIVAVAALILLWRRKGAAQSSDIGWPAYTPQAAPSENAQMSPFSSSSSALQSMVQAIGHFEGADIAGSLPQRTNNPGDIGTYDGKVASYPTLEDGDNALVDYITTHAAAHPNWNFYDFFRFYLTGSPTGTPGPNQNPDGYAEYVAGQVGVPAMTPVSQVVG